MQLIDQSRAESTAEPAPRARGPVCAFWCRIPSRPNFGDALTPWLISRLTGSYPRFVPAEDPRPKLFVTGSIISYAGAGATVWGAGIMNRDDPVSPAATLLAVRGPLTRMRALACGATCPEIYGDPALLLPRIYQPTRVARRAIALAPHFSDMPRLAASWRAGGELRLVDLQRPCESVIDSLAGAELVASSSLHGIIASHAYGVPAAWIKFRDLPSGDDSKFRDYYLSIGHEEVEPLRLGYDEAIDPDRLRRHATLPRRLDLDALWAVCPLKACR